MDGLGAATAISWNSLLSTIAGNEYQGKSKKCPIRVLDTVFFSSGDPSNPSNSSNPSWYFTTRNGYISKKKPGESSSLSHVVERFSNFALSNPNNSQGLIGVLHENEERTFLDAEHLQETVQLINSQRRNYHHGSFLQVYLRPCRGDDSIYVCEAKCDSKQNYSFSVTKKSISGTESASSSSSKSLNNEMEQDIIALTGFLSDSRGLFTENVTAEFIVDDNERIWLSNIPKLTAREIIHGDGVKSDVLNLPLVRGRSADQPGYSNILGSEKHSNLRDSTGRPISGRESREGDPRNLLPISDTSASVVNLLRPKSDGNLLRSNDNESLLLKKKLKHQKAIAQTHKLAFEEAKEMKESPSPSSSYAREKEIERDKENNAYNNMKDLYGKEPDPSSLNKLKTGTGNHSKNGNNGNSGNIGKNCKKAKSGNENTLFRSKMNPKNIKSRGGMGDSPSMELIAKFAAEKERQQMEMQQQQQSSYDENEDDVAPYLDDDIYHSNHNYHSSQRKQGPGPGPGGGKIKKKKSAALREQISFQNQVQGPYSRDQVQVPAPWNQIQGPGEAERRLEELEWLAGRSASSYNVEQQYFQRQLEEDSGLSPIGINGVSGVSALDSDFHYRQDLGDISALSALSALSVMSPSHIAVNKQRENKEKQDRNENRENRVPGNYPRDARSTVHNGDNRDRISELLPVYEEVGDAVRERIQLLEKQVLTLTAAMERKESEQERTEGKLRRTFTELEAVKRLNATEKAQVESKHERAMVLLKEQHLKEMGDMASSLSIPLSHLSQLSQLNNLSNLAHSHPSQSSQLSYTNGSDRNDRNGNDGNGRISGDNGAAGGGGSEGQKKLVVQLEFMKTEQRRMEDLLSEDRRALQAESSAKLQAQERTLKTEISDLRWQRTTLEDRLTQLNEDFTIVHTKADSLQQQCRQLEQSRDESLDAQKKLRNELKVLQQSGTAAFRLDSSNSASQGAKTAAAAADYETLQRLNEAKTDAKVRQLTNKLDFLKAQLSSEQASSEDLKAAAQRDRSKVEEMRVEFRVKMQEADHVKEEAVERAERQMEAVYTDRMQEFTALQAKAMSVAGQLQIAYQETATAKQREETARVAASKANAQQIALRTEIDNLRDQLQNLRDEKEADAARAGSKHSQDATVRRLDNERQYLKSQLASEITLKNELHEALYQCQQQLGETQTQWRSDVDNLKESTSKAVQDSSSSQLKAHHTALSLEAEVNRLTGQNRDLKEGYTQMRDQLRSEQVTLENFSAASRRLQESIDTLKSDAERTRQSREQECALHEQQVAALNSLLAEEEDKQVKEKARLRDELSKQFNANSASQLETFAVMKSFDKERRLGVLQIAAVCIFERVRKIRVSRMSEMFRVWNTNTTLIGAAQQFHTQVNELVRTTLSDAKRDREFALESLRRDLEDAYAEREQLLRGEFDLEIEAQKREDTEERVALDARRERELQAAMSEEGERRDEQLVLVQEAGEDAIADIERRMRDNLDQLESQHQRELDESIRLAREGAQAESDILQDALTAEWEARLMQRENELRDAALLSVIAAVDARDEEHRAEQDRAIQEFEAHKAQALHCEQTAVAAAVTALTLEKDTQLQATILQCEEEKKLLEGSLRLSISKELEESLQLQRNLTDMKLKELQVVMADETARDLQLKDQEREETVAAMLKKQAVALEAERARGLKLEASKWKQALKEAEKRLLLEVNQAKVDAREERDAELQLEIAECEERGRSALRAVEEEHRLEIDKIIRDNSEQMIAVERRLATQDTVMAQKLMSQEALLRAESEDMLLRADAALKEQLSLEWTVRLKNEVVAALEQSATANQLELAKYEQICQANERALVEKLEERLAAMESGMELNAKQEQANWRLILRETQEKCALEVEEARALGRKEREREMRVTMEEVEQKQRVAQGVSGKLKQAIEDTNSASVTMTNEYQRKIEENDALMKRFDVSKKKEIILMIENFTSKHERLKSEMTAVHKAEIDSLHVTSHAELEQSALVSKELIGSLHEKLNQQSLQKDQEREETVAAMLKKQAVALEAERARGLKLEASKWKQALKEAEKRLLLEVNQAKVDAREERDAELQLEIAESVRSNGQTGQKATPDRTLTSLRTLEQNHAAKLSEKLSEQKAKLELESEEKVLHAENVLKGQLSLEWAARVKVEVDAAWDQAAAVSASKVAKLEEIARINEQLVVKKIEDIAARGLKFETLKWQKVVEDLNRSIVFRVSQAQADAKEETVREMGSKMDEKEIRRIAAMSALQNDFNQTQERLLAAQSDLVIALSDSKELRHKAEQSVETIALEEEKRIKIDMQVKDLELKNQNLLCVVESHAGERRTMREENEVRVRELRAAWQEEMTEQLQLAAQRNDKLIDARIAERTVALEAERARGLKLEASKWKQALKEAEKRLLLEVNQAKVDAREERDAELQLEIAECEERGRSALRAVEEEHRLEIDKITHENAESLTLTEERAASQQIEAVKRAESVSRDRVSEEWAVRLKAEVDAAWEQGTSAGKVKLLKSQEALEVFKRDVTAQSQRLATERSEAQERVADLEQEIVMLKLSKKEEKEALLIRFAEDKDAFLLAADETHRAEIKLMTLSFQAELDKSLEDLQSHHTSRLKIESESVTKALEKKLTQVHKDSIEQLSILEANIAELEGDKATLTADLQRTKKNLEDETDIKFDLQQESKKTAREYSFFKWKMCSKVHSMSKRLEHAVRAAERALQEELKSKEQQSSGLSGMALSALKLSGLFTLVEDIRRRMQETLRCYRVGDLTEMKGRIKSLEKEVEKLEGAKDAIEEQRDDVEEEIERLEEQLKEIEEQTREHSLTTSTTNGRINAAYARKKKRLDEEFERLLQNIESKRNIISEFDQDIAGKASNRDEKEAEMIDLEKQLVQILVEQQKAVLLLVEEGRQIDEKCRGVISEGNMPWPALVDPTAADVIRMLKN